MSYVNKNMNECQYGCMVSLPSFCSRPNAWARALIYYHVCVPAWVCVGFLCIALPFLSITRKTYENHKNHKKFSSLLELEL